MSQTTAILQAIHDQLGDAIEEIKREVEPIFVDGEEEIKKMRGWGVSEIIETVNLADNRGWRETKVYYWPGLGSLPRLRRRVEDYIRECREGETP